MQLASEREALAASNAARSQLQAEVRGLHITVQQLERWAGSPPAARRAAWCGCPGDPPVCKNIQGSLRSLAAWPSCRSQSVPSLLCRSATQSLRSELSPVRRQASAAEQQAERARQESSAALLRASSEVTLRSQVRLWLCVWRLVHVLKHHSTRPGGLRSFGTQFDGPQEEVGSAMPAPPRAPLAPPQVELTAQQLQQQVAQLQEECAALRAANQQLEAAAAEAERRSVEREAQLARWAPSSWKASIS